MVFVHVASRHYWNALQGGQQAGHMDACTLLDPSVVGVCHNECGAELQGELQRGPHELLE